MALVGPWDSQRQLAKQRVFAEVGVGVQSEGLLRDGGWVVRSGLLSRMRQEADKVSLDHRKWVRDHRRRTEDRGRLDDLWEMTDELRILRPPAVYAIVGESNSSPTIALASVVGPFSIPVISHFATCACLSDKKRYPSFFRTIPSDYYQSRALAQLVKYFGWTWVGTVRSRGDYGNYGIAAFEEAAKEEGVCIEYSEAILSTDPKEQFLKTLEVIKKGTARVVVAFVALGDFVPLLKVMVQQNITGLQWVGSESWITSRTLAETKDYSFLSGAVGFAIANAKLTGLRNFLVNVHPDQEPNNEILKEFWETTFQCSFRTTGSSACSGSEKLAELQNEYTDESELRIANKVYTAVYAVAYTLHNILEDFRYSTNSSIKIKHTPQKVYNIR
ncbi:vomeronasal type-2 receptor 1-like [Carassius auratus]|uniref:Vomeronasal type-2 receptor 1-like n=1 Tax=Carassius auratus TaxID=7957 RepID=A0A6P6RBY8_CARAU|nr:vomeronasal type-2 receptor 1-like [Carassius auratus]